MGIPCYIIFNKQSDYFEWQSHEVHVYCNHLNCSSTVKSAVTGKTFSGNLSDIDGRSIGLVTNGIAKIRCLALKDYGH